MTPINPENKAQTFKLSRRHVLSAGAAGILTIGIMPSWARTHDPRTDKALAALDKDKLIKLALDLTNMPTPLGQEEKTAQFYYDRMKEEGLVTRLQPFAPGRSNALGIHRGSGGGRSLMLNGHLETGGSDPLNPFPVSRIVDGEWLSGVGMWNMKGALAAYVAAISAVRKAGIELSGDVLIAGTAGAWDETPVETKLKGERIEGYGVGMKQMLSRGGIPDMAVVGEPTSFKIVRQQFGTTLARIDIDSNVAVRPARLDDLTGDMAAVFKGFDSGYQPTESVAKVIRALNVWAKSYVQRNRIAGVPPGARVSGIEGGQAGRPGSVDTCSIFITANTPPQASRTVVLDELKSVLAEVRKDDPSFKAHAELYSVTPGASVPTDSPLVSALRAAHTDVFDRAPQETPVQWVSDALPLFQYGIPAVNYGPTGMIKNVKEGTPAGTGEFLRIGDLIEYTRVLIELIVRLCGDVSRRTS